MYMHTTVKKRTVGFLIISFSPALILHNIVLQKSLQKIMLYFKKALANVFYVAGSNSDSGTAIVGSSPLPDGKSYSCKYLFSIINYQQELGGYLNIYSCFVCYSCPVSGCMLLGACWACSVCCSLLVV